MRWSNMEATGKHLTTRVHDVGSDILRGNLWRNGHFGNDMLDLDARR
jgi:hypothetical protein